MYSAITTKELEHFKFLLQRDLADKGDRPISALLVTIEDRLRTEHRSLQSRQKRAIATGKGMNPTSTADGKQSRECPDCQKKMSWCSATQAFFCGCGRSVME